jgi:hypothetical protein
VLVSWRDEKGPCTAAGRYPADASFLVRMPALVDRLLVRRGIDQAAWNRRTVSHDIARLIASHLHTGRRSALHRFVLDGSVAEEIYDELQAAATHRQYAREWVDALARYCLARDDTGPVASWNQRAMTAAEARAEEWLSSAGVDVGTLGQHGSGSRIDWRSRYPGLLVRKQMPTEMAAKLIDAAFLLGVAAARKRRLPAIVEQRIGEPVAVPAAKR